MEKQLVAITSTQVKFSKKTKKLIDKSFKSFNLTRAFFYSFFFFLISCGTNDPTSTLTPNIIPTTNITPAHKIIPAKNITGGFCKANHLTPDPLLKDQWHLKNTGQDEAKVGIDINVFPVWEQGCDGSGVNVGVLDTYFDINHPDLKDNLSPSNLVDYSKISCHRHGTLVAGIIAARDNNIGVRGIAPRATLYAYQVSGDKNTKINAWERPESTKIAVYNMSFGDAEEYKFYPLTPSLWDAFEKVTQFGFNNLGSSLVFAAGNSLSGGAPSNTSYLNHYAVITVNSINKYGILFSLQVSFNFFKYHDQLSYTIGANLWITAPTEVLSTDPLKCGVANENYATIGKTSGATPMVTGAIALLRQAYPSLTWRDIKLILAESARKDIGEPKDYIRSGKMFHDPSQSQKYHHIAGFGLLDIGAAFTLAKNWKSLPTMKSFIANQNSPMAISKTNTFYTNSLTVNNSNIKFIESVTIEIKIKQKTSDLMYPKLFLKAPDGTEARFYNHNGEGRKLQSVELKKIDENTSVTLLANAFLGNEKADGDWKLKIFQYNPIIISEITSWKIIIRGH